MLPVSKLECHGRFHVAVDVMQCAKPCTMYSIFSKEAQNVACNVRDSAIYAASEAFKATLPVRLLLYNGVVSGSGPS